MSRNHRHRPEREQRLDEVLVAYLKALEAGQLPDRQEWLRRYPDLADELAAFFTDQDRLERLAAALPLTLPAGPGAQDTLLCPLDWPGHSFGDYELLEELGLSAMSVVYKARQKSLNRLVALKMIHAGRLASAIDVQRFRNEAELVAGLDHPHIVPIYEVGTEQGRLYFTMKLIEGGSLATQLPRFLADPRSSGQLLAIVARAIHHAHQRGVLHRDLKPSNILLAQGGQEHPGDGAPARGVRRTPSAPWPMITDFGLAKRLEAGADLTQSGVLLGTPSYMAPEQTSGRLGTVTTATDVYGLGAVLYALLTGQPPFRAATALETLVEVQESDPLPPSRTNLRVDRDLETICLKCLQKEPQRRYSSAEALAQDLERWLRGEPIQARPLGRLARTGRWFRRNPLVATLTTTVGLLLGVALVILLFSSFLLWREQGQTKEALKQAQEERGRAEDNAAQTRRYLYTAQVKLAADAWNSGDAGLAQQLLARWQPTPGQEDLRSFAWYYLWDRCRLQPHDRLTLHAHEGDIYQVAFAPDGKLLATAGADGTARLWDVDTGRERAVLRGHRGEVNGVAFAPDGRLLATAADDWTVRLWDVASGQECRTLSGHAAEVVLVLFTPDGRLLVSADRTREVKLWDPATGQEHATFRHGESWLEALALSPDGRTLATAGSDMRVTLWDLAGHQRGRLQSTAPLFTVAFAPDGRTLATGNREGVVELWDIVDGLKFASLQGGADAVRSVAFSPDGLFLAAGGDNTILRVWDRASQRIRSMSQGHFNRLWSVAYSPDGKTLAVGDRTGMVSLGPALLTEDRQDLGECQGSFLSPSGDTLLCWSAPLVTVWETATGQQRRRFDSREGMIHAAAISRDGRRVAVAGEKRVTLWDLSESPERLVWTGQAEQVNTLVFLPDGHTLLGMAENREARFWDVVTGQGQPVPAGYPWNGGVLGISPDGRTVALVAGPDAAQLFDPATGQRGSRLEDPSWLRGVFFSQDGRWAATRRMTNSTITLWDARTGENRARLVGHRGQVRSMAFTPGNRTLASGGTDELVKLWDVATGQELLTLEGHTAPVCLMAFAPDARFLATVGRGPNGKTELYRWPAPRDTEFANQGGR